MPFDEHFLLSVLERSPLATVIYDSEDLNIAFANRQCWIHGMQAAQF
ncbi:Uncharacterised protein [Sphingobacterium multivorum]|uniref:Uncharacterized protein n=1 Tax=Sphingobacterium multivorum TaxID=28454 RepID=A0A2X2J8G4_SPHMU|nr:Uncharacterised protein [Sphingobacterium multivorum]